MTEIRPLLESVDASGPVRLLYSAVQPPSWQQRAISPVEAVTSTETPPRVSDGIGRVPRRPAVGKFTDVDGICKCGAKFTGPPNRRNCDECSSGVQRRGRRSYEEVKRG